MQPPESKQTTVCSTLPYNLLLNSRSGNHDQIGIALDIVLWEASQLEMSSKCLTLMNMLVCFSVHPTNESRHPCNYVSV